MTQNAPALDLDAELSAQAETVRNEARDAVPLGRSAAASPTLPRSSAPTFVAAEPPLINLIDEVNARDY